MTTQQDELVSQLVVNRLTKTQFNGATPDNNQLWAVDPEWTGGKMLATDANCDIVETNDVPSTIVTLSVSDSITLTDACTYNGSELTSLTIALPSTMSANFVSCVQFSSGTTATTVSFPSAVNWAGDDLQYDATLQKEIFVPVASKRYTLMFWYDGTNTNCVVKGF